MFIASRVKFHSCFGYKLFLLASSFWKLTNKLSIVCNHWLRRQFETVGGIGAGSGTAPRVIAKHGVQLRLQLTDLVLEERKWSNFGIFGLGNKSDDLS